MHADWEFVVNIGADIDRITSDKYSGRCTDDNQRGSIRVQGGPKPDRV